MITVGKEAKIIANTVKNKSEKIKVHSFNDNVEAINLLKDVNADIIGIILNAMKYLDKTYKKYYKK